MPNTTLERRVFDDPATAFSLPYRLFIPAACTAERPCGMLLFLHGAGERGQDNEAQLQNHALAFIDSAAQRHFPTVVVYPQCPEGKQWVDADWAKGTYAVERTPISRPLAAVVALLDHLLATLPVDPKRQLLTGLSMGGYGAWDLLARFPERFAAAMPLCGGGDPSHAARYASVPIWAFHGVDDAAVPVQGSRTMIRALEAAGGTPRYDEAAGIGHDIWNLAYTNGKAVAWLLSAAKK